jgi:hypothetical protein
MDPAIQTRIWQHAGEDISVEICGVLVGKWVRDADGPYAHVLESIRGDAAANKFAEVTFTHETWARINQQMDSRFSQMSIIGWYHSHPSFGIFQIAYVVDPVRKTEGVFSWREGKPHLCSHFWVGDRIQVGTAVGEESPAAAPRPAAPAASSQPPPAAAPERTPWTNLLLQLAVYLLVFLLGYFLAGKLTDLDRLRIEQATLARSLVYFKIHLGLRDQLTEVEGDLQAAAQGAKTLAQEHLKLLQDPQEPQARWAEVLQKLDRSSRRIAQIGTTYALTPQEEMLFLALAERLSRYSGNDKSKAGDDKSENKKSETPAVEKREVEPPTKK